MRRGLRRLRRAVPALAVALAALAVGCGGGGGGAKASAAQVVDGSPSDPTGGAITTGGTTGANATTGTTGSSAPVTTTTGTSTPTGTSGSGTTGMVPPSDTGGTGAGGASTDGATTGSATTGSPSTGGASGTTGTSAGGDPTTGGPTGSGTTGSDTGGSGTGGTSDGTTTGGTTGSGTTGSTGSGSTGSPYPLRANAIYFGHADDPSLVSSVYADGSGRQDAGGAATNVVAAVPDPDTAGSFVYVATVNGLSGVYRGTSFDPAQATQLAAPAYDYVSTLQAGANGAVIVVAGRNGASNLYLLEGGGVRTIDTADGAALSVDSAQIAYTKLDANGVEDLYVWNRATGVRTGLVTGGDALLPSFSKDGAWVLFSSSRDDANGASFDLYQVPAAGGTVERITSTPTVSEFGACYNEARTQISYVGVSDDPSLNGVYALSNLGTVRIASDGDVGFATYWTNALGRGRGGVRGARFQRLPRRKGWR